MSTKGNAESYVELKGSLSLPDAIQGKSAYEIAVINGFKGTEEEWLEYIRGKSAYEIAVKNGYEGTEEEWLAYWRGGPKGGKGDKGDKGDKGESLIGTDCQSISADACAAGNGTLAGSRGFRIIKRGVGTFHLDGYTGGYAVGDAFSLRINSNFDLFGKITGINGNVISVDNMPSEDLVVNVTGATIKGKWKFNGALDHSIFPPLGEGNDIIKKSIDIGFTNNAIKYSSFEFWGGISNTYYLLYDNKGVYGYYGADTGNWYDEIYRTVDFGTTAQNISLEFYDFITKSAVAIDGVVEPIGEVATSGDINTFRVPNKPNVGNVDIGKCATAFGMDTKAVGAYSNAEGNATLAHGKYAHTEGTGTSAAFAAHAEGDSSSASGAFSHAEGGTTKAVGECAHAEGCWTEAGNRAHAEGWRSKAVGDYSHAEGNNTRANGEASHTEGYNSQANGKYSHAEGGTSANGSYSHSEGGNGTTAAGDYSHAEGTNNKANGSYSHAEGGDNTAQGAYSHVEGYMNLAQGEQSHAEGQATKANGKRSHTEGFNTIAHGVNQHVQGRSNIEDVEGKYAHIVGNGTGNSARSNAHTLDWDGNAWYKGKLEAAGFGDGLSNIIKGYVGDCSKIATGSYVGTGELSHTISLPFEPKLVFVQKIIGYNSNSSISWMLTIATDDVSVDYSFSTIKGCVVVGTVPNTVVVNVDGTVVDFNYFSSQHGDSGLNTSGEKYRYVAFG